MTILEEIFEENTISFIKNLLLKKEFEVIRGNANYLLSLNEKEFSQNFEYALTKSFLFPIEGKDPFTGKELNDATEIFFLYYLSYYSTKGMGIIEKYIHHCRNIEKQVSQMTIEANDKFSFIFDFVNLRINRIDPQNELPLIKVSQQNTLKGKKLNLSERYEIVKRVFDFDNKIRTLNISEAEKDLLLSLILDCNTTNARHIMNGKYAGKVREDLISEYVQGLKK